MKAYKIEILVIDYESIGEEDIKCMVENVKHIHPMIVSSQSADIGEWGDYHPLNSSDESIFLGEYKRLFD